MKCRFGFTKLRATAKKGTLFLAASLFAEGDVMN